MAIAPPNPHLDQSPATDDFLVRSQGDHLRFTLTLNATMKGTAWLRTNLGCAHVRRDEIVRHVEEGAPILARDWHDIPMRRVGDNRYVIVVPLVDVGTFSAKAFFLPQRAAEPVWPHGGNTTIKIEPADYTSDNGIYTAFVRQFRPKTERAPNEQRMAAAIDTLEADGYNVIPKSGTFRDLIGRLDHIMLTLGFRIVQLLPVFPTPTTYARMGRFGSPFAALDFMAVDPAMAEFDRQTTPLDQFRELADAVHARQGRLFIDIPINHTGWASWMQNHHPEWFVRNEDRTFHSPGAWGVTWEDLSEIDYHDRDLWRYMADVFLFWCRQGVDGFRCDAGYMVPYPVWEYVVAKVRQAFPTTVFLLEGLGGKTEVTEALLAGAGLNWAYSEIFQNSDRSQLERYLPGSFSVSARKGMLVDFAETHDNNRLAATSQQYARMRTTLAALTAPNGAFGITNGVEWYATEKVDVHGDSDLRWGAADNQVEHIARLNRIVDAHPAFHAGAQRDLIHADGTQNALALRRCDSSATHGLLVLVNLDHEQPGVVAWPRSAFNAAGAFDLLTGDSREPEAAGRMQRLTLSAGEVLCLTTQPAWVEQLSHPPLSAPPTGSARYNQVVKAKALEILRRFGHGLCLRPPDMKSSMRELLANPRAFCLRASGRKAPPPVTEWLWPRDLRRIVMCPPGHYLLIGSADPFDVRVTSDNGCTINAERSLRAEDGSCFALLSPPLESHDERTCTLEMTVYEKNGIRRAQGRLLYLARAGRATLPLAVTKANVEGDRICALSTNSRGAMCRAAGDWGRLFSTYDALLAANLHPEVPVDRQVLLTRCRAWIVYRGYSCELCLDCIDAFSIDEHGGAYWHMTVPVGLGKTIPLTIEVRMVHNHNAVTVRFLRGHTNGNELHLADQAAVRVIVRPDIEDRNFHSTTKAYTGPERQWPGAVQPENDGFVFAPNENYALHVHMPGATFSVEPEWAYMIEHPVEAERGLDPHSDLFSPGYFVCPLTGGHTATLVAEACLQGDVPVTLATAPLPPPTLPAGYAGRISLEGAMRAAIDHFIVKRDASQTVIAGYPWFLDWGRDTLICLRGIVAAGRHDETRDMLVQFARFEQQGTLPNMIRGNDDSNRDTSDAPLWFFVACADLLEALGHDAFLEARCGRRTIRTVLKSIANNYIAGTPNGIRMDPATGLIYSPSHFTWMDTNHPAGTPREGYPIEIQALWHAALKFLARIDTKGRWQELAAMVRQAITKHYVLDSGGYLSDCLHTRGYQPVAEAVADDALRPNQLLAITLGAITSTGLCVDIVRATEELLVPGAIRSLADRPVAYGLPVYREGALLNDPHTPYWGHYRGDEDTRRKPAYHNGTAWTWPFPSYSEALYITYGPEARETALAILDSSAVLARRQCYGHIPEIVDGDAPHADRGCDAQAWGATELLRVLRLLNTAP